MFICLHLTESFSYDKIGVCEAIINSDGLESLIALLGSSNILLYGLAAVTINALVRNSSEGQRKLLKQYGFLTSFLGLNLNLFYFIY